MTSLHCQQMKHVIKELHNQPCRVRDITENEKSTFAGFGHLQRYHPALELFNVKELISLQFADLPSKYVVDSWDTADDVNKRIWNVTRRNMTADKAKSVVAIADTEPPILESDRAFVKVIHLIDPIDILKEKYSYPEHQLIPHYEPTWKNTLLKLHSHNNQAYVDTVANFVLSRFKELDLCPHLPLFYGALT